MSCIVCFMSNAIQETFGSRQGLFLDIFRTVIGDLTETHNYPGG